MGGEFMSVHCEAPENDVDALRAITNCVLSLDEKAIDYFAQEVLGEWEGSNNRAIVLQAAIEAYDHVSSMPRDMDYLFVGGKRYWLTGGLSWGDFPTDSFAKIFLLAELEVDWSNS